MKKILLVEDTDSKAEMIISECESLGFEVTRVSVMIEGRRALKQTHDFVAVITDWVMPFRVGEELRDHAGEMIFHDAKDQNLPVIVVSNRETIPAGFSPWIQADKVEQLQAWLKKL
jgi:CheY-like chemotaxis protein